jgi:hypothetical protein
VADPNTTCFVISPIGSDGSSVRKRSDDVFTHILEPAAKACGYVAIRADKIAKPGIITNQVIQHLLDAPLVVADLTDHNANVYYELAIRHAIRKPLVEIIKKGQVAPFDVAATRLVQMDDPDLNNVETLRTQVKAAIKAAESTPTDADNPITLAVDIRAMGMSGKPIETQLAAILETLAAIQAQLTALERSAQPSLLATLAGLPSPRGGMNVGLGGLADLMVNPAGAHFDDAATRKALQTLLAELAQKSQEEQKPT